jgi:hypothetical protein
MSAADYQKIAKRRGPTKAFVRFDNYLMHGGYGEIKKEFIFHPTRKWRFDWALTDQMTAFEYDGLMNRDVGHASIEGILRDVDKINEAQALGWNVYRVNAKTIGNGTAFTLVDRVLRKEGQSS